MAYSVIDKVYTIFIDVMTGSSNGYGKPTFYNTDSHTSFIELTVTNGSKEFNMTEFSYMFTVEKPDGTKYTNEYTTQDKSKLVIPVDAQMISCTGNCNAQLYVNKEVDGVNKTLTMVEFNYTVYKGLHEGLISESVDFDNVYVKILNKLDYIINNGADLTGDQAAQLAYAYQHSKSPHAPANIVETMHTEIGEAIDAHHKKVTLGASQVGSYSGTDITIKPSQEGMTRNMTVRGRTLQNFIVGGDKKSIINKTNSPYRLINYKPQVPLQQGVTYTLVVNVTKIENAPGGLRLYLWNEDNGTQYINYYATTVGVHKINFPVTINASGLSLYSEIADFDNGCIVEFNNVMLLKGNYNTPDAYIPPYFEGIRSVGDKSKNLFKGYDQEIQLEAGKTYYLSSAKTEGATRIAMQVANKEDVTPIKMYWQSSNNRYSLATDSKILHLSIVCNKNTTVTFIGDSLVKYNNIQLEEGTVATAYEPYFEEGTSLVRIGSCGKNLVDLKNLLDKQNADYTIEEGGFRFRGANFYRDFIVPPNPDVQYTLSAEVKAITMTRARIEVIYEDGSLGSTNLITEQGVMTKLLLTTAKGKRIKYFRMNWTEVGDIIMRNLQLEEGNTLTDFEPYQEDVKEVIAPIRGGFKGISDTICDTPYVDINRKETWVIQRVDMHTFDGKETWSKAGVAEGTDVNTIRFQTSLPNAKDAYGDKLIINYPTESLGTWSDDVESVQTSSGGFYIRIKRSRLETQDEEGFKKWLQSNPITVYYELLEVKAVPTTSKSMINLKTYSRATHISSIGDFKASLKFALDSVLMTTDAKQFCATDDNKNFVLPEVTALSANNALEIHLFVKMLANATLSFPSNILWNDLAKMNEIVTGSVAEFIFTYIKTAEGGSWLGTVVPHK